MRPATIHGYADRLSVAPGEPIEFKVSTDVAGSYRADVVRLIHGDTNPAGPGFKERVVDSPANGEYEGRYQPVHSGSHVTVFDAAGHLAIAGALSVHVFAMPTTPGKGVQRILGRMPAGGMAGYALEIAGGRLRLTVGDGSATVEVESDTPLHGSCWYSLGATYDPATGQAAIYQAPVRNSYNSLLSPMVEMPGRSLVRGSAPIAPADAAVSFVIAGDPAAGSHFNGKLDGPKVWRRALAEAELDSLTAGGEAPGNGLVAHWDFSDGIGPRGVPTDHVRDVAGLDLFGVCVNQPARGMTGWNWDCSEECYRHAPRLYGAIHFHDDDL
ncbi:MAG: LamG domain-containing protein, partial [Actinomycetota bacterium]|nr:LamG domain-containing protein [Actinomycetota bacterium]